MNRRHLSALALTLAVSAPAFADSGTRTPATTATRPVLATQRRARAPK